MTSDVWKVKGLLVAGLARLDDVQGEPMPGERACKVTLLVLPAALLVLALGGVL